MFERPTTLVKDVMAEPAPALTFSFPLMAESSELKKLLLPLPIGPMTRMFTVSTQLLNGL